MGTRHVTVAERPLPPFPGHPSLDVCLCSDGSHTYLYTQPEKEGVTQTFGRVLLQADERDWGGFFSAGTPFFGFAGEPNEAIHFGSRSFWGGVLNFEKSPFAVWRDAGEGRRCR